MYYLKRDLPIKSFPPHSHRQVITVEENPVWFLLDEGAVDTDVVQEFHFSVRAKPDEVDDIRDYDL